MIGYRLESIEHAASQATRERDQDFPVAATDTEGNEIMVTGWSVDDRTSLETDFDVPGGFDGILRAVDAAL